MARVEGRQGVGEGLRLADEVLDFWWVHTPDGWLRELGRGDWWNAYF